MNAPPTTNERRGERLVDSPWFWVCLFGTAAVAGLLAIGPKYKQREARLESSFRMREHLTRSWAAGESGRDPAAASDPDSSDNTSLIRSTGPLVWILLVAVAAAWSGLIWSRRNVALHAPRDERAENAATPELSPTHTSVSRGTGGLSTSAEVRANSTSNSSNATFASAASRRISLVDKPPVPPQP